MVYRAYIFDLDDTLIDTINTKIKAIQHTGKSRFNADIDDSVVRKLWGKPFAEVMRGSFPEHIPLEHILAAYKEERGKFPSPAFPGTKEALDALVRTSVTGILSSHTSSYLRDDLIKAGIPPELFAFIYGSEDTQYHKPDPRVFDEVLAFLKEREIDKEEVVYVGDSIGDYEACRGAGVTYIAIPGRTVKKETFDALGIKTIPDITHLVRV